LRGKYRFPGSSFLILFLLLFFLEAPGDAASGGGNLPQGTHGFPDLAAVAGLPDGEFPLGETIVELSSLLGAELTGVPVDSDAVRDEIARIAERVRPALEDRSDPRRVISALNRFLFVEEGYVYDGVAENPDNFLLDRVIARKRGNCLGLTALYLLLAERLSLPLHGVYVPSHVFVRYEDAGVRFDIETGEKGAEWEDGRYLRKFRLAGGRPYLRSLSSSEMIAVYLKSLGAVFSRKGREDRALRLYREAAVYYPGLPDVYFNAGVSFQKKKMLDEAIAQYRRALALDPDLAVAHDNLGVALAKKGLFAEALVEARKAAALRPRNPATLGNLAAALCANGMVEEGIREYRKVLDIDPGNARALVGLTKAYYARGEFREAVVACDRAIACGWNPDPAMLGALEKYRDSLPGSLP